MGGRVESYFQRVPSSLGQGGSLGERTVGGMLAGMQRKMGREQPLESGKIARAAAKFHTGSIKLANK